MRTYARNHQHRPSTPPGYVDCRAVAIEVERIRDVERRKREIQKRAIQRSSPWEERWRLMREWLQERERGCPVHSVSKSVSQQARRDARLYRDALNAMAKFDRMGRRDYTNHTGRASHVQLTRK